MKFNRTKLRTGVFWEIINSRTATFGNIYKILGRKDEPNYKSWYVQGCNVRLSSESFERENFLLENGREYKKT